MGALERWNVSTEDEKNIFRSQLLKESKSQQTSQQQQQQKPSQEAIIYKTPFLAFSHQKRAEICEENPEMKPIQVMHQVEDLWQSLSSKDKEKYNQIMKQSPPSNVSRER